MTSFLAKHIVKLRTSPSLHPCYHTAARNMTTTNDEATRLEEAAARLSKHYHSAGARTSAAEERERARTSSGSMMGGLAAPLLEQMGLLSSSSSAAAAAAVHDVTGSPSQPQKQPSIRLLDSACGPGVFTREVQGALGRTAEGREVLARSRFVCADSSPGMVEAARRRMEEEEWVNAEARVADAMDTGLPDDAFTHVAITLGLHLIPQPDAVLADVKRVLRHGGMFGATTFPASNADKFWFADLREAFASMPFEAPLPARMPMQVHGSGRWYDAGWVEEHLTTTTQQQQGTFRDVRVRVVPGRYRVESPTAWLRTFGGMLSWVTGAWWPEELRAEHGEEEVRGLVRRFLEEKYGDVEEGWDVEWEVICMTAVVDKGQQMGDA
ncbi:hypothetical protein JDV02_003176 [Purpureocillium takamizusanense]|uniref:Methyltransferase domain-containing protein n=1 Tax=Purpureocillium takamizusanense TaxID=2060973 RepID=A0A9Q8QD45_9HYPO|nr:uncharacterized protein JDV02_003176 [Purpureocillium takamizusanense]UNI16769.1 hypothetical protein JDV02_003176 [Purpureocillium takamizusanense]